MNLTNIKYLFDLMDKEGFTYFTIYDSKGSPMRDQTNESYSVQDAKDDLTQFLDYNSGVFRVEFRRTKQNTPSTKNYSFTIDNMKPDFDDSIQGIGNYDSGIDYMAVIRDKDAKIDKLQSEMFANMISAMNKQHELQMEALRKEMKNAEGGNDQLMQTALQTLSGMFGGSNIGLSGIETMAQPTQTNKTNNNSKLMDDEKKAINQAVVRLMKGDENFAKNITKLADLCDENPLIYKMAISKLDSI
mgnify:CR=1 FL=1